MSAGPSPLAASSHPSILQSTELPSLKTAGRAGPKPSREPKASPRVPSAPEIPDRPDSLPETRVDALLKRLEWLPMLLDRIIHRFIPEQANPFGQLGAVANTCLIYAVISGVAMLLWYTPSVHQAYASLESVRTSSWLGQLVRSLHRYSADACLFAALLHAARITFQRRFTGPRWLAWTSGLVLLSLVWAIGWTGYWLVWDTRAQHVAVGTAPFVDTLPIFTEPFGRAFLTDESVHSLFFFLVFFAHMLMPLAVAISLWIHLMRLNRARLFTSKSMTLWIGLSLLILSALLPATSAAAAHMNLKVQKFTMDWWYLWPLSLTDRLSGGMLWLILFSSGLVAFTVPWTFVAPKRRAAAPLLKAQVELPRCIGCTLCAKDCPFDAITMIPREDGKPFAVQSHVNPDLCVGCGICTGACDSEAINISIFESRTIRKTLEIQVSEAKSRGEKPFVAFCCGNSAGSDLNELNGYRIERVPCAGAVSAVMLERILKAGAEGVLVIGCGESDPVAREGIAWFSQRMAGTREPRFDIRKADPARVRFVRADRTNRNLVLREAAAFREDRLQTPATRPPSRAFQIGGGIVLAGILGFVTWFFSDRTYFTPHLSHPELVVSFNHSGAILEPKKLSKEELAKRLPHMRAQINVTRQRVPVRLRVRIDGTQVLDHSYAPRGISKDGPSIALARLPVSPGKHQVMVDLADGPSADKWTQNWTQEIEFVPNRSTVVLFDSKNGFSLHQ